jgi:hypothetical protein
LRNDRPPDCRSVCLTDDRLDRKFVRVGQFHWLVPPGVHFKSQFGL